MSERRKIVRKRRFLRFTSVDGVADILGVLRPQGLLLALEVKRPGRRPTPKQEAFLTTVREHNGIGACVQSVAELEQMFPTWSQPLPRAASGHAGKSKRGSSSR